MVNLHAQITKISIIILAELLYNLLNTAVKNIIFGGVKMGKATKKVEGVTEELKNNEVVVEKKAAAKKKTETEKKTVAKKKTTTKKAADKVAEAAVDKTAEVTEKKVKKTTKKKLEADFYVEYPGHQVSQKAIMDKFVEVWEKDRKLSEVKDLKVYFNVEESTAYFVVNEEENLAIYIG